jgi:hypothetical protein
VKLVTSSVNSWAVRMPRVLELLGPKPSDHAPRLLERA